LAQQSAGRRPVAERVFLPLAADGRHVDMLLCLSLIQRVESGPTLR